MHQNILAMKLLCVMRFCLQVYNTDALSSGEWRTFRNTAMLGRSSMCAAHTQNVAGAKNNIILWRTKLSFYFVQIFTLVHSVIHTTANLKNTLINITVEQLSLVDFSNSICIKRQTDMFKTFTYLTTLAPVVQLQTSSSAANKTILKIMIKCGSDAYYA